MVLGLPLLALFRARQDVKTLSLSVVYPVSCTRILITFRISQFRHDHDTFRRDTGVLPGMCRDTGVLPGMCIMHSVLITNAAKA